MGLLLFALGLAVLAWVLVVVTWSAGTAPSGTGT